MIDLKQLRADPDRFKRGARDKGIDVDIDRLIKLDEQRLTLRADQEARRGEQKEISKQIGPQIGKMKRQVKEAGDAEAGLRVAILARSIEPVVLPRAVGLDGESVRAFQRIGLGEKLAEDVGQGVGRLSVDRRQHLFQHLAKLIVLGRHLLLFGRESFFRGYCAATAFGKNRISRYRRRSGCAFHHRGSGPDPSGAGTWPKER